MSGTLPWYVARASGLVAWALLAASVVWGLLMTSKVIRRFVRSSVLLDLHRWLGGLALVFTSIHVLAILSDTYIHFGLASVLVPLASRWHPVMVAYGIAALYLLVDQGPILFPRSLAKVIIPVRRGWRWRWCRRGVA